ncbi:MAG: hypothetical protein NT068_00265 [Candidatus Nomurabacteria bacterium]|nr:hypothetical protein [Candidatus Nomurabacteria bacterium]
MEQKSNSALIGSVIIIIILIIGGVYLYKTSVKKQMQQRNNPSQVTTDEFSGIETDLNTTDINNIDSKI